MKIIIIVFIGLVVLIFSSFIVLGKKSQSEIPDLGMVAGQFKPCKYGSNCVNSMEQGVSHIAPLFLSNKHQWFQLPDLVSAMGGEVKSQKANYLRATFTSRWFGFVDDVELFWDVSNKLLHVRSASRVGRSDFGVNRKRMEALQQQLSQLQ